MNREVNAVVLENGAPSIRKTVWPTTAARWAWSPILDFEVAPELAHHDVNDVAHSCTVLRTQMQTWCCPKARPC